MRLEDPLPDAQEQADDLLLWVGERQPYPGANLTTAAPFLSAWIGAMAAPQDNDAGLRWLLQEREIKELLGSSNAATAGGVPMLDLRLTMAGWKRFDELKRRRVDSRVAFMAMKFNDPELDQVVENYFRPAVDCAGFQLQLLTDGQGAGLIDDQLRVAIRRARFAIIDLTHGNRGAYWEAGFAEGLGRPVIYTCRKDAWEEYDADGNRLVHFDTAHLVTIIWDPADLPDAARRLTDTIRATLPDEAKLG